MLKGASFGSPVVSPTSLGAQSTKPNTTIDAVKLTMADASNLASTLSDLVRRVCGSPKEADGLCGPRGESPIADGILEGLRCASEHTSRNISAAHVDLNRLANALGL